MLLNALLGQQNPLAQWASGNNNFLTALGAGIASGPDLASGIGAGLRAAPQAKMADMEAAQQREEKARQTQQQNATKALLMEKAPDLAQLLDTGIPMGEVWGEYLRRQQPQGPVKPIEVNGQLIDPVTFEVLGDFRTPESNTPSLPTSYQEWLLAQKDPAYGASLNSSTSRPPTEGQRRNQQLASVVEPQVQIIEENWKDLTDPGNQSIGFNTIARAPGFALTSPGYQRATNALKTIAQSYLYSVSGAAATDAETQKIVDSVTPKFGESEQSVNDKKALIRRMVESIKAAGGGDAQASSVGAPAGNVDDILGKYGL